MLVGFIKIFYIVALFQILLISLYLIIQKKGKSFSRTLLVIVLIDFAIFLTGSYILLVKNMEEYHLYGHLANLTVFLAPPLLYFYYLSAINPKYRFNIKMLYHAIPFICILAIMFYKIVYQNNTHFIFRPYGISLVVFLFLQNIFYLVPIYKLKSPGSDVRIFSDAGLFKLLTISIISVFVLKLLIFFLWNLMGYVVMCVYFTGVFFTASFTIINLLVLYGLNNPGALLHNVKYQYSPLDNCSMDRHFNNLVKILEENKLYLNPLLNLDKLARQLHINGKLLSQIINESTGANFNDFINQYRIKEAQRLMTEDIKHRRNILNIAYEVGFNSKSTFNEAFRKYTNITPSEYRKNLSFHVAWN
jgi:AraC-like DNA-binding protein